MPGDFASFTDADWADWIRVMKASGRDEEMKRVLREHGMRYEEALNVEFVRKSAGAKTDLDARWDAYHAKYGKARGGGHTADSSEAAWKSIQRLAARIAGESAFAKVDGRAAPRAIAKALDTEEGKRLYAEYVAAKQREVPGSPTTYDLLVQKTS